MTMTESPLAARLQGGTGMFAPREAAQQVERERNEVPAPPVPRPNAYAGSCVTCGERVEAQAGVLAGKVDGRWTVAHHEGQCPEVQQALPIEEPAESIRTTAPEMQPGIYTLETPIGHRTFRVVLHKEDSSFAPGSTTIEYLCGSDNDHDYKGFAFIKGGRLQVWKRFRGEDFSRLITDAEAFLADPASPKVQASLHCLRCNATLTTPTSIAQGMGPTCITKGW
jgi:uncharacterized protein DUF6011